MATSTGSTNAAHRPPRVQSHRSSVSSVYLVRDRPPRREPNAIADRLTAQEDLLRLTDRLVAEFAATHAAGTVLNRVARARETLLAAGVRERLLSTVEAVVRAELTATTPTHH
jgi:hypothetical protein